MFRLSLPVVKYALVVLAMILLASASQAQERKTRTKIKGKVDEVSEGRLIIIDASDNTTKLALQVGARSKVDVEGSADVDYLTPGVNVHFFAEMTAANVVPEPLKEITICTIDEANNTPLCISADPTKPKNKGKDALNNMEVRGTIKTNKNGKMTINVPSQRNPQQVKITLAPDLKVLAHFTDLAMVRPGDEVNVPWAMEIDPVLLAPQSVKITMANPLVADKTTKKAPAARKPTAKSSK
jgi:uncharacterized protein YdbL (DUF1318 family)